jgi:molecular chaperone GrpE
MPSSPVTEEGSVEAQERNLEAELAELEDRFTRARADLENYRKRTERDVQRRVGEARDEINREWLQAVDSVERALRLGEPQNPMSEGLRRVLEQMEAVLNRHGIKRVGTVGEAFDPERHEAVGVVDTDDHADRSVIEVARSGYASGDRVLRPAQVIVARKPAPSEPGESEG